MGPLAVAGISAGIGAIKNIFGNKAKNKQAKVDAANANARSKFDRDTSQKGLDRRRKILQGMKRYYRQSGLLGDKADAFDALLGDLGFDVGAEAYQLPEAPTFQAGSGPGFWGSLAEGALGGAVNYLESPAQAPMQTPRSPGQPGAGFKFLPGAPPPLVPGEDGVDIITGHRRF